MLNALLSRLGMSCDHHMSLMASLFIGAQVVPRPVHMTSFCLSRLTWSLVTGTLSVRDRLMVTAKVSHHHPLVAVIFDDYHKYLVELLFF